jgi:hypothetical protein
MIVQFICVINEALELKKYCHFYVNLGVLEYYDPNRESIVYPTGTKSVVSTWTVRTVR